MVMVGRRLSFCGNWISRHQHSSPGFKVPSSRKKSALCATPKFFPINSSTSSVYHLESSDLVKRRMYRLEKFLGVSYEGFEEKASDLFSAIESSQKGYILLVPIPFTNQYSLKTGAS